MWRPLGAIKASATAAVAPAAFADALMAPSSCHTENPTESLPPSIPVATVAMNLCKLQKLWLLIDLFSSCYPYTLWWGVVTLVCNGLSLSARLAMTHGAVAAKHAAGTSD